MAKRLVFHIIVTIVLVIAGYSISYVWSRYEVSSLRDRIAEYDRNYTLVTNSEQLSINRAIELSNAIQQLSIRNRQLEAKIRTINQYAETNSIELGKLADILYGIQNRGSTNY